MAAPRSNKRLTIAVGKVSPFVPLPVGKLTVAMTLKHSTPVVIVGLPVVTDVDIVHFQSPLEAVGLWQSATTPSGAMVLVLKVSQTQVWTICVPFLDSTPVMRTWAANEIDDSSVQLVLVDTDTQIVHAHRTASLPPRLLEMVRTGIRRTAVIDQAGSITELNALPDSRLWDEATQWRDLDDSGIFTLVRPATKRV
jgi:hypothetical protein